jgi:hypothetical protein
MKSLLVCLLVICLSVSISGQENPFDLKYRKQDSKTVQPKTEVVEKEEDNVSEKKNETVDSIADKQNEKERPRKKDEKTTSFEIDLNEVGVTKEDSIGLQQKSGGANTQPDWAVNRISLFLLLLAMTLLVTLTISSNKKIVNKLIKAVLNDNYLNLLYREQKKSPTGKYFLLYLVFSVNLGLFIYFFLLNKDSLSFDPVLWKCIVLVISVYLIRHIFLAFISFIYEFNKEVEQFAFTVLIFNVFLGLLLLPVNVFIAFSPNPVSISFLYFGLVLVVLTFVFRQLRGLFLASGLIIESKFYFFLYLCAVEIAPLLLINEYLGAILS